MGWFPYWGTYPGFPWFMLIMPLIFFGMMFVMCRLGRWGWSGGCCFSRGTPDIASEVTALRKEIEELKKKIG